ncbi:MAG: NAD(P)-binding domain-containing protein [Bacteroidetes bacterium]|nr:NAD(P)-binding domain-containing protein [Bacteroidota bacterium]
MKGKVLFIDTTHPYLPETLSRAGYSCDYFTHLTREKYIRIIGDYTGIIIRGKIKLDREILENAVRLRFIGRVGAGMENIDQAFAESRNIKCINAPEGNRDALAEHTTGMLLSLLNHLKRADAEVRQGIWKREKNRGAEIGGKTIAIIGCGNMGSAFAKRLKGFNVNIIAYDKYKKGFGNDDIEETGMDRVFEEADFLSLHVPLTEETTYLVDEAFLSGFRKNIFLINTSRGKVVNTHDLVMALKNGKIKGAVLDVLEYEGLSFESLSNDSLPADFKYLATSEKVILSPHIAGWSLESHRKLAEVVAEKIIDLMM